ncbi:serine hydrolase domain-containing protein [Streptomyces indicus]|uniref:D-alanyl-D-alanine carboxypeptidase n=1 Tax=Streptomyces indicus TaxID=417292 RepID=A0A1G8VWD8_9ACTN|nr:serine hydrolase domain-containing protein [Streptomyces indicus]SDJ70127.1 D-alanyl-D-alanine carboxypeptidase [Streptomyces indicus]
MRASLRTTVAAALVLGLAAGGTLAAPAFADGRPATAAPAAVAFAEENGPDVAALEKALQGLPDEQATAALVRVGGDGRDWHGVAGVSSLKSGAPARDNVRFRAGSTTKIVTAALTLRLVADGELDLDGTVQEYLPGLLPSPEFEPITVRQLLNYTSGLKPGASLGDTDEELYERRFETLTPQEVVAASVAAGPLHSPGTHQRYSNIHYTVLGLIIEKVTGDSFAHQAQERIFRPLGMRDSYFPGSDPKIRGPHHRGYQEMNGKLVDVTEWNVTDRFAAGDMISSARDLERFLVSLFQGRIVPEPQLQEMFTVPTVDDIETGDPATMAAGLERIEYNGKVIWGKTGARPGFHTVIGATRDLSRTVVYSVNATDAHQDGGPLAMRFAFPAFNR